MRHVAQPGLPAAERIQWAPAQGRAFTFAMQPGLMLLEATRRGFAEAGFTGGVLNFEAGALAPFAYVMPALSTDGRNAAFYSQTFRPPGVTRLTTGAMTFGSRDGAPFFHCHALWREADGRASGGHILPDETIVAEAFHVRAVGLDGATFAAEPDSETNFKLFGPIRTGAAAAGDARFFALRLRPNQELFGALEGFCLARGIAHAKLHGGVGSTIGAHFADGRIVEPFATEVAIRAGSVAPGPDGAPVATIDAALIDYTGGMAEGLMQRGDNPVLMTMELVLEAL